MNDPHVAALIYYIEHNDTVDYSNAPPIEMRTDAFIVKIDGGEVRVEPLEHLSTEESALDAMNGFISNWELDAVLRGRPGQFRLRFNRSEILDRSPAPPVPGRVQLSGAVRLGPLRAGSASITVTVRKNFPEPPAAVTLNPDDDDVVLLLNRFRNYCDGKELLTSLAYFCSTILEERIGDSQNKGVKLGIGAKVRSTIRRLSTEKGGKMGARKRVGIGLELTAEEKLFLEEAIKLTIRRMAHVSFDDTMKLPKVTMADLPKIP